MKPKLMPEHLRLLKTRLLIERMAWKALHLGLYKSYKANMRLLERGL